MSQYYADYVWKNGIPYGILKLEAPSGTCYKIPMDPYRKRISIEQYDGDVFRLVVYDSSQLDFRHLKSPAEQTAWQKIVLTTSLTKVSSLIRNQDDRLVCLETCLFDGKYCVECRLYSPLGPLLSTHRMFYQALNASFDGVVLYDANDHPVMIKKYAFDAEAAAFTDLLEESWEGCEAFLSSLLKASV